jgi:hypothetical protein
MIRVGVRSIGNGFELTNAHEAVGVEGCRSAPEMSTFGSIFV